MNVKNLFNRTDSEVLLRPCIKNLKVHRYINKIKSDSKEKTENRNFSTNLYNKRLKEIKRKSFGARKFMEVANY